MNSTQKMFNRTPILNTENILLYAFEEFPESLCKAKFLCFHQQRLKGFSLTITSIHVSQADLPPRPESASLLVQKNQSCPQNALRVHCFFSMSALLGNSLTSKEQEEKLIPCRVAGTWNKIGPEGQ